MIKDGSTLKETKICLINIFKSIDGECYHSGKPTVFLRTMYCNLRCKWPCDTPECWSEETYHKVYPNKPLMWLTVDDALARVQELDPQIKHLTITGGEPLLLENQGWMKAFTEQATSLGYVVDFETNGAVDYRELLQWRDRSAYAENIHFITDWKCPSSGMTDKMVKSNLGYLREGRDYVKCVVTDTDFPEVEKILNQTAATVYISPCFGKVTMNKIPEFVLQHSDCHRLCAQIQAHKSFWPVNQRDV